MILTGNKIQAEVREKKLRSLLFPKIKLIQIPTI